MRPQIKEKIWGQFVVLMNQEHDVTPDVGRRSVNDVLEDVVAEIKKNREKQEER